MAMRAKFPAGSEQEIASIVTVLQSAGYTARQISLDEIELDPPQAPAEDGQAAGCDERTIPHTPTQPDSIDPNLPRPEPEIAEREFVLAPLFRKIGASVSERWGQFYLSLRRGLGDGWSARAQRLDAMGRALSGAMSVCWGRIAHGFASLKGTALQRRANVAPPDARKEKQRRPLKGSYRTADRIATALAGAVVMATLVLMYVVLTPHHPSPSLNLQTVQSAPSPTPVAPRARTLTAVARTLPKPSPVVSSHRVTAAYRGASAEDDIQQEVIVRQFPQRRIQPAVQQGTQPRHISDLDE